MTAHLDPQRLVPYGRWRHWTRALRARGGRRRGDGDSHSDRLYLVYGATLLALMYVPVAWVAVEQAGVALAASRAVAAGAGGGGAVLLVLAGIVLAAAALGALALPRVGLPLGVSAPDARFALVGVWPPRTVLWRRGVVALGVAGTVGALVASALASALLGDADGPSVADLVGWALCAAGVATAPVAVGVAAQGPRWRRAARALAVVLACAAAGVATWVVTSGPDVVARSLPALAAASTAPPSAVVGCAVVVAAVAGWLLLAVLPDAVDVDAAAEAGALALTTGVGLAAGEAAGLRAVRSPARRGRRRTLATRLLRISPLVARDVLGLRRRPGRLAASVGVGVLGVAAVAAAQGSALVAVGGALLLYGAAAPWTAGLEAMAKQSVPGGLFPGRIGHQVAAHAVVPVIVAAAVAVAGALAAQAVGAPTGWPAVGAVVFAVLGARVGVAGATTVPGVLFTPVAGPTGDVSLVAVAAWYLRGWLVVAAVAWLSTRSVTGALVVAVVVAAGWGAACVSRLAQR